MSDIEIFKLSSIEKAEEEYKKLHILPEQKERLNSMVNIISKYLPIPQRALKGFMWMVIKDYQMQEHVDVGEEEELAKEQNIGLRKLLAGLEVILSMLKEKLTRILVKKEQESILNEAFRKIIAFYKEQFARM
ncbi:MAG: hypothetical protein ACFFC3_15850 [Candidatus Odinarchaeota archaeon]